MALTNSYVKYLEKTFTLPSGYTSTLYIYAKLNSQDIANNTSNVSIQARIKYGYPWYAASAIKVRSGKNSTSGNYAEYTHTYTSSSKAPQGTVITCSTWTGNIAHNTDGTATLGLYGYVYQKEWSVNKSWTGSVAVPTIPRASQPTITPNPFNIGDTITINPNRKVNTYTDNIQMVVGSGSVILAQDETEPFTFDTSTIENDFYALMGSTSSYSNTVNNSTYNGDTLIGSNTTNYTALITNADPTFTVGYKDTNATTVAITGNNQKIIRNKSTLQINITNASALKGATLSTADVVLNGNTYSGTFSGNSLNINVGTVDLASNDTASVTVTDSRGSTTTQTIEIQVYNWELPSAIITCGRRNNYYSETDITVDADYSSLGGNNTITIQCRYKKTTSGTWGAYQTLTDNTLATLQLDNTYSWDIQVLLTDLLGSTTYNLSVDKGIPIAFFDRLKRSVSVNCFPQNTESLEVGGVDLVQDKQDTLISGTNIKTINNTSLLGSGNITIGGGGTATDVQINGTSIVSSNVADIKVDGTYNASSNKIATMSSLPSAGTSATAVDTTASGGSASTYSKSDHKHSISSGTITSALGFTPQATLTAGNNIDITSNTIKTKTRGVEYIVGTQAASTNAWTGTSTDTDCSSGTIYTGKVIVYHLPYAGTSTAATLNLTLPDGTTTGAKNIYRLATTTVTTTFAADCDIFMVYDGTEWKVNAYVDTNTNTIGYQLRTNSALWTNKTGYASNRYTLLFEVDGGLSGAATTIGTGTSKTTVAFKYIPNGVIKYYSTSGSIANGSNFGATGLWDQYTVDLRYTFNIGSTLTSGKPVYMRCSVNADGTISPNYSGSPSHPIVQALPNSADGYVYVYLGQAYSTNAMELMNNHPIYEYKNSRIREWQYDTDISGKQDTLVSGTNIKTINNTSLLGSGNINIGGGGASTDVQINGTSITSGGEADIQTYGTYNSSTNKIATMTEGIKTISDDDIYITDLTTGRYFVDGSEAFAYLYDENGEELSIWVLGGTLINVWFTDMGGGEKLWYYTIQSPAWGINTWYDTPIAQGFFGTDDDGETYVGWYNEVAWRTDLPTDTGWQTLTKASGISNGNQGGVPQYRKIGSHVFLRGMVSFTASSSQVILATLPADIRPQNLVYKMVATGGTRIGRLVIDNATGKLAVDWVYRLDATSAITSGTINWFDIEMDYFTD